MKIRNQDKQKIEKIVQITLKTPLEIWAYGSRVNGEAHDTSDLDLVIVTKSEKKLNIKELTDFKDTLQESNIPILIQVMDWNRIPESFHKNILINYEVLLSV